MMESKRVGMMKEKIRNIKSTVKTRNRKLAI